MRRMADEEMLTTSKAAQKLGVSLRAVQKMIEQNRLAAKKFGRDYLIRSEDLNHIERRSNAGRPPKSTNMAKKKEEKGKKN